MKHRIIILLFASLLGLCAFAQTVSEPIAHSRAAAFFANQAQQAPGAIRDTPTANNQLSLAYTSQKNGNTCFYVFNRGENGGFVIVGGDAVAHEILAYVPQGHFNYDSIPDNVKWWLEEYAKEISAVKKMKPQARPTLAPRRSALLGETTSVEDLFTDIPDLITTKWNQTAPYNVAIPAIHHTNGDSIISPTGCVPTAMAQIMNYWHWPVTGVGSYSYTLDYGTLDEWSAGVNPGAFDGLLPATFSADFGNTTYDWANMADVYDGTNSQVQIDAVSTLMYHVGVAGYTLYGPGGSGGGMDRTMEALKQYFRYSNRMTYLNRGDYLDDEWEEIIYSELSAGRPVYYESNGHAFILHGYSANNKMFSVNWGWGGFMDGYWKITGTDYAYFVNDKNVNMDFTSHAICIRIEPVNIVHPNNFSYVGDTIVVDGIRYDLIGPLTKTVEVTYAPNGEIIYEGELTIPDTIVYNNEKYTVTKIGRYGLASGGGGFGEMSWGGITALTELHLPNTLRSVAYGGLRACEIEVLQVPERVEMLGQECFSGMTNLKNITLPSQLTYIPNNCFTACERLEKVDLPATIRALGNMSFCFCPSLYTLVLNAIEVPTYITSENTATFDQDLEDKLLVVPQAAIDDYRNDSVFGRWGRILSLDSLPAHFGETFTVEDIQYKLLVSGNEVFAAGYVGGDRDTLIIPASIVYDGVSYSVKEIGPRAFNDLRIDNLFIENGVRRIGEKSFQGSWMSSVYLPPTMEIIKNFAFGNCQSLKTVNLSNGITTISDEAFAGCWRMKSFAMPNSVANLGAFSFWCCDSLKFIKLSSSLIELPSNAFHRTKIGSIVLPPTIAKINSGCFYECYSLNTMICYSPIVPHLEEENGWTVFPSNVTQGTLYVPSESISAYQSTPSWQNWGTILPIIPVDSIHLEDISIGKMLFDTVRIQVFPYNATEGQIFYSSSNPKIATIDRNGEIITLEVGEVTITAETMDGKIATCIVTVTPSPFVASGRNDGVFWTISEDSILNVFGTGSFGIRNSRYEYYYGFENYRECVKEAYFSDGITLEFQALYHCYNLTKVELPSGINNISTFAFSEDRNLKEINLPSSITSIENYAFSNCDGLTSIILPVNVLKIGNSAFSGCRGLTSITIPNNVTSIGDYAFYGCSGMTSITIGDSVSYIGNEAFNWCFNVSDVYCYANPENLTWLNPDNGFKSDKATIFHVHDAEAWENAFPTANVTFVGDLGFLLGDINGDGVVNVMDATALIGAYLKGTTDALSPAVADVNHDGVINVMDATEIINIYLNNR